MTKLPLETLVLMMSAIAKHSNTDDTLVYTVVTQSKHERGKNQTLKAGKKCKGKTIVYTCKNSIQSDGILSDSTIEAFGNREQMHVITTGIYGWN